MLVEVIVDREVGRIGVGFHGLPPDGAPVVKQVAEGTWAEHEGIQNGDEFLEMNQKPVTGMATAAFLAMMQERPLTIKIWRSVKTERLQPVRLPSHCATYANTR